MKNLIRVFLLGAAFGVFIGWMLRDREQERKEKAASEAYANDPEVVALRKEFALIKQVDNFMDSLESDDES